MKIWTEKPGLVTTDDYTISSVKDCLGHEAPGSRCAACDRTIEQDHSAIVVTLIPMTGRKFRTYYVYHEACFAEALNQLEST